MSELRTGILAILDEPPNPTATDEDVLSLAQARVTELVDALRVANRKGAERDTMKRLLLRVSEASRSQPLPAALLDEIDAALRTPQ